MDRKMFNTVLVLSPHTDDGELGAGGTISKLVEYGSEITYLAFSAPRDILKKECEEALKILGVKKFDIFDFKTRHFPTFRQEILELLFNYSQKNKIDLVLTPSTQDLHQDHKTMTDEALRAFKYSTIFGYELPWNNIYFRENCFISLEERHVKNKLNALECYNTQKKRQYFKKEYLKSVLRSKGIQIGKKYAEAFEVIKFVFDYET